MAQTLRQWLDSEVVLVKDKPMKFLSQYYFHRVEVRAKYIDSSVMFTPADGVIMGAYSEISANKSLIDVKGVKLTLRELMQDDSLAGKFIVVSVFMTFYSQHQNYIPYSGYRVYEDLDSLSTFNKPMLRVEKDLLNGIINPEFQEDYLRKNAREISTIYAPKLGQDYYMIRIGDYDVDTMVNWHQPLGEEAMPYQQNDRFGMITYGSSTILVVPIYRNSPKFTLRSEAKVGNYVKCCYDGLINIEF